MASMNVLSFALAAFLSFSVSLTVASELHGSSIRQRRCNIGLCFAIDGSESISRKEFRRQISLARKIIRNTPSSASPSFAAVQYGISNQAISELTANRKLIRRELKATDQLNSRGAFMAAGLNFCFSELFDVRNARPVCRRSFVVVMGNGNGNIGADPAERARLFEAEVRRGDVLVVGFGAGVNSRQLRSISGRGDFFNSRNTPIRRLAREIVRDIVM